MGKTSKRIRGRSDLLTQWLVKYGYVPIALIGITGLALGNFTREWKGGEIIVGDDPVVAETFVERRLPTVEMTVEPKPTKQLAALNPDVRLPEESNQPASKGYIMYANSPTNWTPVPLPDKI